MPGEPYDGETLVLGSDKEELLLAEVDLPGASERRGQRPYTALRRTELYE